MKLYVIHILQKGLSIMSMELMPRLFTHQLTLFPSNQKEKIILYVGRFSQLEQAKNQHILVEEFKKLYKGGVRDWKLVLAGGVEVGVGNYTDKLAKSSKDYP